VLVGVEKDHSSGLKPGVRLANLQLKQLTAVRTATNTDAVLWRTKQPVKFLSPCAHRV